MIAHGVHETGRREILSIDVGEAETEAFWTEFLRGLVKRGLVGVQLAISDAHAGLKAAIAKVLGLRLAALHRPLPARLPRARPQGPARAAGGADPADLQRRHPRAGARSALRGRRASRRAAGQGRDAARGRRDRHPGLLRVPAPTTGASCARPTRSSASTKRSAAAPTSSASSPTTRSLIRLAGMLCIEQNDEWLVGRRYLSAESISLVLEDDAIKQTRGGPRAPSGLSSHPITDE